jgi:hypothetical protein
VMRPAVFRIAVSRLLGLPVSSSALFACNL